MPVGSNGDGNHTKGASDHRPAADADVLIREVNHRCANDLALVVSLLSLKARRAQNEDVRVALMEMADRVAVLARARAAMNRPVRPSLSASLHHVREALASHAEPRSIDVSVEVEGDLDDLTGEQINVIGLAVNELATNAIKHAFFERKEGSVRISARRYDDHAVVVRVDDDGLPLPTDQQRRDGAIGLSLVPRLVNSIHGSLILPADGSKCFEIRVPVGKAS